MKVTRIAGRLYDEQNASEVQRLLKVHEYVSHIRRIARDAAKQEQTVHPSTPTHAAGKPDRTAPWSPEIPLRLNT